MNAEGLKPSASCRGNACRFLQCRRAAVRGPCQYLIHYISLTHIHNINTHTPRKTVFAGILRGLKGKKNGIEDKPKTDRRSGAACTAQASTWSSRDFALETSNSWQHNTTMSKVRANAPMFLLFHLQNASSAEVKKKINFWWQHTPYIICCS